MTAKSIEERLEQWAGDVHGIWPDSEVQELNAAAVELRRLRFVADGLQMANESLRRKVERLREASDVARAADRLRCADAEAQWQAAEIRRLRDELAEYKRFTYELRDHCAELDDERRAMRSQLKAETARRESAEKALDEFESQLHRDERPVRVQLREAEALLRRWQKLDGYDDLQDATDAHFARFQPKETT